MTNGNKLLIILAKAPVQGEVNTRLVPYIGAERATALQQELILLRMEQFALQDQFDIQLWCAPDTTHEVFKRCQHDYRVELRPQKGMDLGERMSHAIKTGCETYGKVVLIGTDAPAVDRSVVEDAFNQLDTNDVVIAPAEDGGYVLIGMNHHYAEVFLSVPWGGERVMNKTRANLVAVGLKYSEMNESWDIDRPEDLERYQQLR